MRSYIFAALVLWSASFAASAAMQAKPIEWNIGEQSFSGYVVYDDANATKRPGLVMFPNWMGVTASAVEKAKHVAGDDYVVLVADVYGKAVRPKDTVEAGAQTKAAFSDEGKTLRMRAQKAVDILKEQVTNAPLDGAKIGVFGFCFGGSVGLELARAGSDVAGVVSLHGGLDTYMQAESDTVQASILVLNGADDSNVSNEQIAAFEKEMNAAKVDWQFVNFSGAVHCFAEADANRPPGCVYNERAAKRAYRMLHDFFAERFASTKR